MYGMKMMWMKIILQSDVEHRQSLQNLHEHLEKRKKNSWRASENWLAAVLGD